MKKVIKAGFTVGYKIIGAYFAWMIKYSKHPEKYLYSLRYKKSRDLIIKVINALDVKIQIEGLENIPSTPCLFICNHLSAFDPLALIAAIETPTTFVSKIENKDIPFAGRVCTALEVDFIDRKDLKQSLRVMMNVQKDLEQKKKNWIIFPEGTRNKDEKCAIKEFHQGSLRPAIKTNTPIVPVCIKNSFEVFDKKRKKTAVVKVTFLKNEHNTTDSKEIKDIIEANYFFA